MPRSYQLGKRAATAARTRQRILDAARRVLVRHDFRGLSLDEVAELAGCTRVTIYNQLGNRSGLIAALFEDAGRRMGLTQVFAALALPDPTRAVLALVRENCRAWARERPVLQRLVALATIDADARKVLAELEGRRLHDVAILVARLRGAKRLAPNVGHDEATVALGALTSFPMFDQLAGDDRDAAQVDAVICRLVAALLREPSTKSR